jgi:hypothetical protein
MPLEVKDVSNIIHDQIIPLQVKIGYAVRIGKFGIAPTFLKDVNIALENIKQSLLVAATKEIEP